MSAGAEAAEVFVLRNQLGQYWSRGGEWVDGREPQRILRTRHRDEAVNQLVELSTRDSDLRGEVLACPLDRRGAPAVEPSAQRTPTHAERAAAPAGAVDAVPGAADTRREHPGDPGV